jgi:dTMP kinase
VSDRYLLANVVYQGHAGGLDPDLIRRIGEAATGGLYPDLVLVLDIDLDTAARRLSRPLDKLESRGGAYRERLRAGYHAEAAGHADTVVTVDATAGIDDVAAAIRAAVIARFGERA